MTSFVYSANVGRPLYVLVPLSIEQALRTIGDYDMNFGTGFRSDALRFCALGCFFVFNAVGLAQTNSWIKPSGGKWEETNAWSLGILPAQSQSVFVQNTNPTTVLMDRATAQNYQTSFSVSSLTVGTSNTLAMSDTGEEALTAPSGISLAGTLMMSNAVVSAQINGSNGVVVQTGGLAFGGLSFNGGNYFLTNGEVWGDVSMFGALFTQSGDNSTLEANSFGGALNQNGGVATIGSGYINGDSVLNAGDLECGSLEIYNQVTQNGGTATFSTLEVDERYNLNLGLLRSSLIDLSYRFGGGSFYQQGGTNEVGTLELNYSSVYSLTGGLLRAGDVNLVTVGPNEPSFEQQNATAIITNTLSLAGDAYHYPWDGTPATYGISNGMLSVGSIVLNGGPGPCDVNVLDSTVFVSGSIEINGLTWSSGRMVLSGGLLGCSDVVNNGGCVSIDQGAGAFIVTNRFVFGGYSTIPYANTTVPAVYTFSGGTLSANDIEIDADMVIGDSAQAGRISNSGSFQLAGEVDAGNINEALGKFILSSATISNVDFNGGNRTTVLSNALINFVGNSAVLAFADSHFETWSNSATLLVSNWNGSLNGGGSVQLRFGNNASGLTGAQVNRIRFVNPGGFLTGTYAARMLSTGEVVPYAPEVSATKSGNGMVITWPDNSYILQGTTNILGPWTNVAGASSPYTSSFDGSPIGFFRLVR